MSEFETSQSVNINGFDLEIDVSYNAHEENDDCDTDRGTYEGSHNEIDDITFIGAIGESLPNQIMSQLDDVREDIRTYVCQLIVKDIQSKFDNLDESILDMDALNDDCDEREIVWQLGENR